MKVKKLYQIQTKQIQMNNLLNTKFKQMNTKLITLGLALFLGFNITAQKKEVKSAEKAMKDNNYEEAIKELDAAKSAGILDEKDKWVVRYYVALGDALFGPKENGTNDIEKLEKSAEAYKKALEKDDSETDATDGLFMVKNQLVNSAVEDQNKKDFSTAKEKLYKSYQLDKNDTIYLYYAAGSAISAQELDDAVSYYEELLELGFDGSKMEYFAVNNETGEREKFGDKDYRDLMVKSDNYSKPEDVKSPSVKAEIAKNTSRLYIQLEQPEKAMEAIEVAKEMDPDDITLLQAEADLYYQLGDVEKYQELMNNIKDKAPDDAMVYYNLGVSAEQLEDEEAAKQFYEKSIELDPEYVYTYLNLARLILSEETKLVEEMNELGMSAADNKRYEQLNKQKKELYEEALPYLEKAYKVDSTNKGVIQTLMNIHYQLGNDDEAEKMKNALEEL